MSLFIDGLLITDAALADTTFGWSKRDQAWFYQARVGLAPGERQLLLSRAGSTPAIAQIAIALAEGPALVPGMGAAASGSKTLQLPESRKAEIIRDLGTAVREGVLSGVSSSDMADWATELSNAVEQDLSNPQLRIGFGGPFNGQRLRQRLFMEIHRALQFDAVLETGAFRGTTTEWFAQLGVPVYSCELDRAAYFFAASRLSSLSNVRLHNEDSREFLKNHLYKHTHRRPAIYLDAHWNDDLPLPEEIDIICDSMQDFMIIVDDFKSPFHGYGYDAHSNSHDLSLEVQVPQLKTNRQLAYCFPWLGPEHETGAKMGAAFIFPEETYERELLSYRGLIRV